MIYGAIFRSVHLTISKAWKQYFLKAAALHSWRSMVILQTNTGKVLGTVSFMRIRPEHGSAELGCVVYSKKLQRSKAATEAFFLCASHIFNALGYRRFEWRCHNKNEASKQAALRYGFKYEGVFRNDRLVDGESRDTAWFAMTDTDWHALEPAYNNWLATENFDEKDQQRKTLQSFMV